MQFCEHQSENPENRRAMSYEENGKPVGLPQHYALTDFENAILQNDAAVGISRQWFAVPIQA
jgi:hypothetical protein